MIRRPINERFNAKVLAGIKIATIRENPWPVKKPIMLYNWSGAAYRSKQIDVAPVIVELTFTLVIRRNFDRAVSYEPCGVFPDGKRPLWNCEGFASQEEMDDWFRPLIKSQSAIFRSLMRFRLATSDDL